MADDTVATHTGIKDRMTGVFHVLIEEANINPALQKLVQGMFTNFLNNTDEEAMAKIISQLQEDLIPYILTGEENDS